VITTRDAHVTADELWSIVQEVWESLLGHDAQRAEHAFNLERSLTGVVAISGDWDGVVSFTCPEAAAREITRTMHALDGGAGVSSEDVVDALGEIANVIGGQVKSLLVGENRLGLPQVAAGMPSPQAQACCRVGVEWAGHAARVTVWRSTGVAGRGDGEGR
jgi:chemotaxis protein CheX